MLIVFRYHAKYQSHNKNYQFWKPGNRPKELLHPRFTRRKLDYIHQNPVRTGWVDKEEDYLYSSARNYMGRPGLIDVELIDFGVEEGYVF